MPSIHFFANPKLNNIFVAILFAYYHFLLIENIDLATFRVFSQWQSPRKHIRDEVRSYIIQQAQPFFAHIKDISEQKDLLRTLLKRDIEYFDHTGTYSIDLQFIFFHKHTGNLLDIFPHEFNENKQHLFFWTELENGQFENIEVITNLTTFFNLYGWYCFFCLKSFRGRGTQHKCGKVATCFACKRPLLSPYSEISSFKQNYFCASTKFPSIGRECSKCNLRLYSFDCEEYHRKKVCRFGWLCPICQKYTYCTKFWKSIENIKQNHVCGVRLCTFCSEKIVGQPHQCQFQVPKPTRTLTKLGFLEMQFTGASSAQCSDCFKLTEKSKNNSISCDFCKDNKKYYANICSILVETTREVFRRQIFTEFDSSNIVLNSSDLEFKYLPKVCKVLPCRKTTYFNQIRQNRFHLDTFVHPEMTVLDKFFDYLLKNEITYTTFLIHDDENRAALNKILSCLLSAKITPHVVGNPEICYIEVRDVGWRFINSTNYIEASYFDLCRSHDLPCRFFPQKWNKPAFYSFCGLPPTGDDFFNANDTSLEVDAKFEYAQKLSTKKCWKFDIELIGYSQKRLNVVANEILTFIKEAFNCQELLHRQMSHSIEQEYIMPFNPPLFTRAGYAFHLLLYFSKAKDLKVPGHPISMTSSKQELEYCSYLRWKYPTLEFIDSWSEKGQKKFRESFPDSFCAATKTAYFFNGCLIHGHPKKECKFKRNSTKETNYFNVPFSKALDQYQTKCTKLIENHADKIHLIKTEWECLWQHKKKTNPDVKIFLQTFYKEPPLSRLDPNFAVRGGLNEVFRCRWKKLCSNDIFLYADLISSYPFFAAEMLPVGEYEVMISNMRQYQYPPLYGNPVVYTRLWLIFIF